MLGVEPGVLAVLVGAVVLGAVVQGVVGLGLGLVAAPVTALVAPELMPGTMIGLATLLPCLTLVGEHDEIDWRGLGWALPARVLGTAAGVYLVTRLPDRAFGVTVGVMVLAAVLLTWRTVRVPVNRGTLAAAGLVGGVAGTATSIGGPPFALLYQHRSPRQIRTTMAVYFVSGSGLSLSGLALAGALSGQQLAMVALLVPALLLGVLLAYLVRRFLDARLVRPVVLLLCGGSGLVLLVRSLAG